MTIDPADVTSVGVVGGGDADAAIEAVRGAGGEAAVVAPGSDALHAADIAVALGSEALVDLARRAPGVPILAVDADPGTPSIPRTALPAAIEALLDGEARTRDHPLLSVADDDGTTRGRALFDAMLVTAEAGRISEYSVVTVDGPGTGLPVGRIRADGIVVATPAGSHGYAHDAGGPALGPGVEAASVVPVAPYTVARERWVLSYPVRLVVERDRNDVVLLLDGREAGRVAPAEPITVDVADAVTLVDPLGSSPFRRDDASAMPAPNS